MKPIAGVLPLFALALACSTTPARTASCQQLDECCHGRTECDPIVAQNDPGACQTQLVVSRGSGQCMATDGGLGGAVLVCTGMFSGATICTEISGAGAGAMCPSGTTVISNCPSASQIGRCTIVVADAGVMGTETLHLYAPMTLANAMNLCANVHGQFSPG